MKKQVLTAVSVLLALAAVFGASYMGASMGAGRSPQAAAETAQEPQDAGESIAIPAFEKIRLRANQTAQEVTFYNPAENRCFFIISLLVDGNQIYRSEMMPPDTEVNAIDLSEPLYSGEYRGAVLQYSCYDLYTQRELNGAEMNVLLEVEP